METLPVTCNKHKNEVMRQGKNEVMFCPFCRKNQIAREQNQILRDICGTSARAAKADMGF